MTKFRTDQEISEAACSSRLRKRVITENRVAGGRLHRLRDELKEPINHLRVVEEVMAQKVGDIRGPLKDLCQDVAIVHNPKAVQHFAEYIIGGMIDRLPCAEFLRELYAGRVRELRKEIALVEAQLRPAYEASGVAHELEQAPPLVSLRDRLRRSIEGENLAGDAAPHAIASAFAFIPEDESP